MNLAIIREWYILIPMVVIFIIGVGIWASKQNKKRQNLMSKKKNEAEELKKMLDSFEKELNAELERELGNIMGAENPFEALTKLGKEPELDPVKDFNHPSMMKKPEEEEWQ